MLTLLTKDFKLMFAGEKTLAKRILNALFSTIFAACFIAIEIFLYSKILNKIKDYRDAPVAFTCIFVAIVSLLMIINAISKAQKLFFDRKDIEQLSNHPIDDGALIGSKLIFLFFNHYVTSFIFLYPVFVAYGVTFANNPMYFYTALFYPVLSFFFEVGVALIFVYPVWLLIEYLKKHVLIEFIVSAVLLFGFSLLYSRILKTFVDMVANNNLDLIFTEKSMTRLTGICSRLYPINFLVDIFLVNSTRELLPYLCIALGVFILGLAITVFMFTYVRTVSVARKSNPEREFTFKNRSVTLSLIYKEVALISKNPDFIFSFTGLLVVQPFLLYLIVVAMSTIFSSGTFLIYATLFPSMISTVNIFVVIMVTLIIASGANHYISMEERTIKNMKTIPIDYRKQLLVKIAIPFIMSEASLTIAMLVILITGAMSPLSCLFAFLISTVALAVFDIISLTEELKIRHAKPRSTFLSTLYAYLLPITFAVLSLAFSFLGFKSWLIYSIGIIIFALLGLPSVLGLKRNMGDWFMELETVY